MVGPRAKSIRILTGVLAFLSVAIHHPTYGADIGPFIKQHCLECHTSETKSGNLSLEIPLDDFRQNRDLWERVAHKLLTRQMPPPEKGRLSDADYDAARGTITRELDRISANDPRPGRTDTLRRLNRTEYQNAIRDLLLLDIDATSLLPADESSHGFDNVTVGDLSPTLLNRYVAAALKISKLAVGGADRSPGGDTFRVRPDVTQEEHVPGLPIGTRGGVLIPYTFPRDGEYEIQIRLTRDRNEEVEGLHEPHELEVLVDRERIELFTVKPPPGRKDFQSVDSHLKVRLPVKSGSHQVGVAFLKKPSSLLETKRQPLQSHFNMHRHPRITPAVFQVSITGPFDSVGPGDTPSRRRLFVSRPDTRADDETCAKQILTTTMRRAYRRQVDEEDLRLPMQFFREGNSSGGFESGIEKGLSAVLVSPHFLFRVERDPVGLEQNTPYRLSDVEVASRLSFFLWSSIPDDELLELAIRGELRDSTVLDRQVRRMLADPKSRTLITNFTSQWLYLRNLDSFTPDARLFPDFDDNLRQAFRQETEMFVESVWRNDQSVLDLIKADYTYVNERLAKHYGVPNVYGSRFRRIQLDNENVRGGLLRHGSILTVTSYATRTSPVLRGQWVLKNILGMPPPPPPGEVPALKENTVAAELSVRERLTEHRRNPACASCHNLIDPVGYALENFDAIGRWRKSEFGKPIDATGGLPDGSTFDGVAGLEESILKRPELFVETLVEKLLTYALGRGIEPEDGPAIRKIVSDAKSDGYRFSALIRGIASSVPFQMRTSE